MMNNAVGVTSAAMWSSELLQRPAADLKVSNDIIRTLYRSGVTIVAQLLLMSTESVLGLLKGMKSDSCVELLNQMTQLANQREYYFDDSQKIKNDEKYKSVSIESLGLEESNTLPANILETLTRQGIANLYSLIESYNQKFVLLADVEQKTVDELLRVTSGLDMGALTKRGHASRPEVKQAKAAPAEDDSEVFLPPVWPLKASAEDCKKIGIEHLGISQRVQNALLRNGITTLYDLVTEYFKNTLSLNANIGEKTIAKIGDAIRKITPEFVRITLEAFNNGRSEDDEVKQVLLSQDILTIPEDILARPIQDLNVSRRVVHAFQRMGFTTLDNFLSSTKWSIEAKRYLSDGNIQKINEKIKQLTSLKGEYFDPTAVDITLVQKLKDYGFQESWLYKRLGFPFAEVTQVTRSGVNRGRWQGGILTPEDEGVFLDMAKTNRYFHELYPREYIILKRHPRAAGVMPVDEKSAGNEAALLLARGKVVKCWFLAELTDPLRTAVAGMIGYSRQAQNF